MKVWNYKHTEEWDIKRLACVYLNGRLREVAELNSDKVQAQIVVPRDNTSLISLRAMPTKILVMPQKMKSSKRHKSVTLKGSNWQILTDCSSKGANAVSNNWWKQYKFVLTWLKRRETQLSLIIKIKYIQFIQQSTDLMETKTLNPKFGNEVKWEDEKYDYKR